MLGLRSRLGLLMMACLLSLTPSLLASAPTHLLIDFTNPTAKVNRAIFGIEGHPKVFMVAQQNPHVMEAFLRLNPSGTVARMETWIGFLEPENDNDDPYTYNWDRLYPDKMIRFIEDRPAFENWLREIDVELMPLLCYSTEWLQSGNEDDQISDKHEWAEFAAAAMHSWNADGDDLRARYAEVWNEPNMPMFGMGKREAYFELFNIAAERLRAEDPTLMVGGPALTPAHWAEPMEWYADFIENCGHNADFVIHHIYHGSDVTADDEVQQIIEMTDQFRAVPGREHGKMALTEIDAWYAGWPKFQYLMQRHFGYMSIADRILSVHHFTTLAYNEHGTYTFGVMTEQGAPMLGTYWPFWIVRNIDGLLVNTIKRGDAGQLDAMGSTHTSEQGHSNLATVIYNRTEQRVTTPITLVFEPTDHDRWLRIDETTSTFQGVRELIKVPAGEQQLTLNRTIQPQTAAAMTLLTPGDRHYQFADLNDQEAPAVELSATTDQITPDQDFTLTARVVNTTDQPISGKLSLIDLPEGWQATSTTIDTGLLATGAAASFDITITASNKPQPLSRMTVGATSTIPHLNQAIAPVAQFVDEAGASKTSLPVDIVYVDHQETEAP
ncbi:GH39 family glycosyl hydrolase [Mucisphaera sp.]|uniref:COG1470 family protein n=1 Tax=Mucisphaera sp. TaxID=2913024 RepID=UPI003D0A42A7